jgi:hypothetical protein
MGMLGANERESQKVNTIDAMHVEPARAQRTNVWNSFGPKLLHAEMEDKEHRWRA